MATERERESDGGLRSDEGGGVFMLDGERRHRAVGREKEEAARWDENCWRERDGDSWKEKLALSDEDRAVSCRWCERERSAG